MEPEKGKSIQGGPSRPKFVQIATSATIKSNVIYRDVIALDEEGMVWQYVAANDQCGFHEGSEPHWCQLDAKKLLR